MTEAMRSKQRRKPFELAEVQMRARQLSPTTYVVAASDVDDTDHAATNAGFVIGASSVLVIESLSNGRLASQLIGEIRRVTPLPLRFLVNTSFHGDHCFGNFVFPSETVIIHHSATKRALDEGFEEDRGFMIDLLGAGLGIEEVVARSADVVCEGSLVLDLGGKRVDIEHIGYAQTDGDLVIRIPDDNVVFVGNMLQAPPPAFPWLFEGRAAEATATYRRLHDSVDDDVAIVPGHGRTMRRADILYSIEYIEELTRQIEGVKAQDATLAQARDIARMESYSGYSMYERIHLDVNVPALLSS
jgi:glyoxylase-like metal-dependent hydrolase (beta-lactamase superfamily II)